MNCPKCGKTVPDGSAFCIACGTRIAPQSPYVNPPMVPKIPKKKSALFRWILPCGAAVALLWVFWAWALSLPPSEDIPTDAPVSSESSTASSETADVPESTAIPEPTATPEPTSTPEPTQNSDNQNDFIVESDGNQLPDPEEVDTGMVRELMDMGYTVEQATEIQYILNSVGVTSIRLYGMTGEAQNGLNSVVCYPNGWSDDDHRFYFTTEDGVLFYAGFLSEDLYDSEAGGFLKKIQDVHIPETKCDTDTFIKLQIMAEDAVKLYLTHPSSADFDLFSWGIGRSDDHYKISGSVNASNSFGVVDKVSFGVWFIEKDGEFEIEAISIGGVRVK